MWKGTLYRGIDAEGVRKFKVKQNYAMGKSIHWSAMSSATPSFETASEFAGAGGIVLRVKVLSGKDICEFSAIPSEDEVLLMPNLRLIVTSDPIPHATTGVELIDMCEKRDDDAFVF